MNKPSRMKLTAPLTVLLFALCNLTVVRADVKPAALFGDHMVLQQGMSVPVWGWADARRQVTAAAKIDGNTIVVTAAGVAAPVPVRYAWNRWPEGANLYNADGLPAPQFRSDDWAPPAPAPAGGVSRGPGDGPANSGRFDGWKNIWH